MSHALTLSTAFCTGLLFASSAMAGDLAPRPETRLFGDVGIGAGYNWLNGDPVNFPEKSEYWSLDGLLRLGVNFGDGWLAQGDLRLEKTGAGDADDSYDWGAMSAAHVAWRDPESYLLGVFGGGLKTDQDDDNTSTSHRYFVGAEGQLFRHNMTFYGQVGWLGGSGGDDNDGKDSIRDAVFGRIVARYFLDPNMKIEAELSGANGEMDSDSDDITVIGWGLKLERQFADNISVSLGYYGNHYDQHGENDTITEHAIRVGLAFHFSPGTLLDKDRSGASLDTPNFLRWSGITGGPLE